MIVPETEKHPVILFDGVCNLCSWTVQFIIKRDRSGLFRFASLQSEVGGRMLIQAGLDPTKLDSIVLCWGKNHYFKSGAVLRILRHLSFPWPLFIVGMVLPAFFRDGIYDLVGRNRYHWFGKTDSCMIPSSGIQQRFLS